MRTAVLLAILGSFISVAQAEAFQARKPILCDNTKKVIEALIQNYNEKLIWTAKDGQDESRYSLFANEKTGSWTILQMTPEYACILGVGEASDLIKGDSI